MSAKNIPSGMSRGDVYFADPDDIVIACARPYTKHKTDTADGTDHPLYDPRVRELGALDGFWVQNVARFGIITPISVRKDGDQFLVIEGRHRVAWARAANKLLRAEGSQPVRVPCVIKRVDDRAALGIIISGNEVRKATDIAGRAFNAQRLVSLGADTAEIAARFGVSEQRVKDYLAFAEADPNVQKAVIDGRISGSTGIELAKQRREDQVAAIAAIPAGAGAREAKRIARANNTKRASAKADARESGYPRPGVAELRRLTAHVLATDEAFKAFCRLDIVNFARWVTGETSSRQVTGLNDILRAAKLID